MADEPMKQLRTVLVADDDLTSRLLIEAALMQSGFHVLLAEDGTTAFELFERHRPDLVLLDVEMPGMDGYRLCRTIRGIDPQVPVLMVTGLDEQDSVARAYDSGATQFISKPVHVPSLGSQLRYILRATDAMRELRALEEQTRAMLAAIPDTLLRVTRNGHILDYQSSPLDVPLLSRPHAAGLKLEDCLEAGVAASVLAHVGATLDTRKLHTAELTVSAGDLPRYYESRYVNIGADEVLILCRDITERRRSELRIHDLAYRDPLTGLPNRLAFLELIEQSIHDRDENLSGPAVLFIDLDGFNRINDALGHGVGDQLLQAAADRLRATAHTYATDHPATDLALARLGADEFAVMLHPLQSTEEALRVAHRIREALARPFIISTHEISVTASIGISIYPHDGADASALLKNADSAMVHSKGSGRNQCGLYSASLTDQMARRLLLENDLRKALERNEFTLYYQPQVGASGGDIIGMEALIRWQHPQRGLIPPGEFIPVAEETGLIVPIGEWVLRTACNQAAQWLRSGAENIRMAVNLCSLQFPEPGLVALVRSVLEESQLPADLLELELTEGVLMDHCESSITRLAELRSLGVHLSIDDFGTGYSSMNYLKSFPVNTIKIDRTFISALPCDQDHAAITMAIVALAHSLRLTVVAEGVETAEQAAVLERYGCEVMQGFYYGRPMTAETATSLLAQKVHF